MKPAGGNCFLDSNVIIYSFGVEENKKRIANELLKRKPAISFQVLNEISNVLHKKFRVRVREIKTAIDFLSKTGRVTAIGTKTILHALDIISTHGFSYYDSLIISSALECRCRVLYSEDLNDGQVINSRLKIVHPFKQ